MLNRTRDERFLARSDLTHIWLDTVRRQTGCYKSNVCVSRMISMMRRRPSVGLIFDRALDVAAGKLVPRSRRSRRQLLGVTTSSERWWSRSDHPMTAEDLPDWTLNSLCSDLPRRRPQASARRPPSRLASAAALNSLEAASSLSVSGRRRV